MPTHYTANGTKTHNQPPAVMTGQDDAWSGDRINEVCGLMALGVVACIAAIIWIAIT